MGGGGMRNNYKSRLNYLYRSMNSNLSRLTDWFRPIRGNKLSLNVAKDKLHAVLAPYIV